MTDPLDVLVVRIREGDLGALSHFAEQYADYIRAMARQRITQLRIAHETEPDEILDATIWHLHRRCSRIQAVEPGEFLAYVERVVRSEARQIWRRAQARRRGSGRRMQHRAGELEVMDRRELPPVEAELNEAIQRAYEQLTGLERLIVTLRRSGWSWREIAASCNITPGGARKRWERAVSRVERLLRSSRIRPRLSGE